MRMNMDDSEMVEVSKNKAIRGYILRSLVKGYNNSLLVRQITSALMNDGLILMPDISKYLDYLVDGGYVEFSNSRMNAYNAFKNDAIIRLTKDGVDLVEGTIEDKGIDI